MPISAAALLPAIRVMPTHWSVAVFAGKVAVLRLRRGIRNTVAAERQLQRQTQAAGGEAQATARSALWSDTQLAETRHQLGKVQNLRRAAAILDGVLIPAGSTFSFWRQLGRASRARGFVAGRMLQQGCVVPAIGGGLCQLSNALYDVALQAGCEIMERHAHSRRVPGSAAAQGRDATVAWNYVDLRFRPAHTLRLSVRLTTDELVVGLHGSAEPALPDATAPEDRPQAQSCDACAQTGCFRHRRAPEGGAGRQAILVDEAWPEFARHVAAVRQAHSSIGLPLPAGWGRPARYAWDTQGFEHAGTASVATLRRSLALRRATPGAGQRQAEADGAARMARALAPLLTPDVSEAVGRAILPAHAVAGRASGRPPVLGPDDPAAHAPAAGAAGPGLRHPSRVGRPWPTSGRPPIWCSGRQRRWRKPRRSRRPTRTSLPSSPAGPSTWTGACRSPALPSGTVPRLGGSPSQGRPWRGRVPTRSGTQPASLDLRSYCSARSWKGRGSGTASAPAGPTRRTARSVGCGT